jgi:hypothetical protein
MVDHGKTHANSTLHAQQSLRLTHVLTLPAILMLGKNAMKAPKDKNGLLILNHALDQRPHQTGEICSIVLRKKSQFHPKLVMTSLRPLVMMMIILSTKSTTTPTVTNSLRPLVMTQALTHADTSLHALTLWRTTHVKMLMTGPPATKVKKVKHGQPSSRHALTTRPKNSGQLSSNAGKSTQLRSEITHHTIASDATTIESS